MAVDAKPPSVCFLLCLSFALRAATDEQYVGATVIEPKRGFYKQPVSRFPHVWSGSFDLKPSALSRFVGLCPRTLGPFRPARCCELG